MAFPTAHALLEALRRLNLVEASSLGEVESLAQSARDAVVLAKQCVGRGLLTPFQVNELFLKRGEGLALGPYVLLDKLGEGGMGAVFKARNRKLDRLFAIKVLRKERLGSDEMVRRFYREIRAAAQLEHPNIVRAVDADEHRGTHYFVMEYVQGVDLNRIAKSRAVGIAEACDIVRQTALGLQHAFERGLVHRDIKPANLLVAAAEAAASADGGDAPTVDAAPRPRVVKILDMGLAREQAGGDEDTTTLTQEGVVMGTPDYIAPEQARSSHLVDIRADLYSLGCTLYFLLTRQVPFPGGAVTQKLLRHQLNEPTPVEQLRPEVPAQLANIVRRLMAKNPSDRFQTPAELVAAIDALDATPADSATEATAALAATPLAMPGEAPAPSPSNVFAEMAAGPESQLVHTPSSIIPVRPGKAVGPWKLYAALAAPALLGLVVLAFVLANRGGEDEKGEPSPSPTPVAGLPPPRPIHEIPGDEKAPSADALDRLRAARVKAAETALADLETKARSKGAALRGELIRFQHKYKGTPSSLRAVELLLATRTPLEDLPRTIPDDARLEWDAAGLEVPDALIKVLGAHAQRHNGPGLAIAISPSGDLVASAGGALDPGIRIWDGKSLKLIKILRLDARKTYRRLQFSPADDTLYALAPAGVDVWDVHAGKARTISVKANEMALSADGRQFGLGAADMTVRLFDAASLDEVGAPLDHGEHIRALAFSADGKLALTAGTQVRVWQLGAGKDDAKKLIEFEAHKGGTAGAAFSADAREIMTLGFDGACVLWDWRKAEEAARVALGAPASFLHLGGDQALVGMSDGAIKLADPRAKKAAPTLKGHERHVRAMARSSDGKRVATTGDDGAVRLWDIDLAKDLLPVVAHGDILDVGFALDEAALFAPAEFNVSCLWRLDSGTLEASAPPRKGTLLAACVPALGQVFFSEFPVVGMWHLRDADEPWRSRATGEKKFNTLCLAFSVGGERGISGHQDGGLRIWNAKDGQSEGCLEAHESPIYCVAVSGDGRFALSGGASSKTEKATIRLWDLALKKEVQALEKPGRITALAFGPDEAQFWSGTLAGAISHWDTDKGKERATFKAHVGAVLGIRFAPDGRVAASWGADRRVVLWDVEHARVLEEWRLPHAPSALCFNHDGRFLALGTAGGAAYIFRAPASR